MTFLLTSVNYNFRLKFRDWSVFQQLSYLKITNKNCFKSVKLLKEMKRNIIMFEKLFKLINIFINNVLRIVFQVTYQTRDIVFDICDETMFHHIYQTPRRELKIQSMAEYF